MPAKQQLPHHQCNPQSQRDHRQRRHRKELHRNNWRNIQTTIYAIKLPFRNRKYANRTELAKHIWKLKDNNENDRIGWYIISSVSTYNNISKRYNLCLTEKLYIIKADQASNLNKSDETEN